MWAYIPVWSCVGLESDFGLCLLADLCGLVWASSVVCICVDLQTGVGLQDGLDLWTGVSCVVLQRYVGLCEHAE